jgi:hypothetical protein
MCCLARAQNKRLLLSRAHGRAAIHYKVEQKARTRAFVAIARAQ